MDRSSVPIALTRRSLGQPGLRVSPLAVVSAAPYGGGMLAKGPEAYPRYRYRPASTDLLDHRRHDPRRAARGDHRARHAPDPG